MKLNKWWAMYSVDDGAEFGDGSYSVMHYIGGEDQYIVDSEHETPEQADARAFELNNNPPDLVWDSIPDNQYHIVSK